LLPVEPFFKFYHYRAQFEEGVSLNETEKGLAENFLGVVVQSNWDEGMDWPEKPIGRQWWRWWKKQGRDEG